MRFKLRVSDSGTEDPLREILIVFIKFLRKIQEKHAFCFITYIYD